MLAQALIGLLLTEAVGTAQSFRLTEARLEPGGAVVVEYPSRSDSYYLLLRGAALPTLNIPVAAALGTGGPGSMRDPGGLAAASFYRVLEVPRTARRDTDQDGIDDVYELERPGLLDPLNPADAQLDPDGNGLTFLQEYLRDQDSLTRIARTSPEHGETGVAVTRETIVHFNRPLHPNVSLTRSNLFASFGGRNWLSRVELATDRRKATLFYLENLPAASRIRVTLNAAGVLDESGRELDADGDGEPGGIALLDFDTAPTAALPSTGVIGRVFASEPVVVGGVTNNVPLAGVTITVDGAEETLRTTTDEEGFFKLMPAPAGRFFVHVDGRTAFGSDWPNGPYYPFVGKAWEAIAGVETNLAGGTGEIYLPLIPADALQPVSATETNTITFSSQILFERPELEGVEVYVPPNALFADDGTRGGRVGIAPVPPDRLPEPLPPGLNFPLVITIQTDGPLNFDRPAPVRFPNLPHPVTGRVKLPGEKSALWSFNHDIGEWEIVGPMTVSADGRFVECDPGVGVRQPGWHGEDPASRTTSDIAKDYSSLPSNVADILWNGMQAGFGFTALVFDIVASESPIGKGFAALNLVLDIGEFIQSPSWANAGKVAVGAASLAPGVGTAMKATSFAIDSYSAMSATGELVNAAQNSNNAFNPGGPGGRGLSGTAGGLVAPPPTYYARDHYQGPQQTAAVEALLAKRDELEAETTARAPLYRDLGELSDLLIAEAEVVNANPGSPFPPERIEEFAEVAAEWRNRLQELRSLSPLSEHFLDAVREFSRFQQIFDINTALVSIERASGWGPPLNVLLGAHSAKNPMSMRAHYRLLGPDDTVQRGRLEPGSRLKFNLVPDAVYRLDLLDPSDLSIASRLFVSSPAGTELDLAPIILRPVDRSADTDGDGLSDFAEEIVGTSPIRADSDGDGVEDGAEVQADTNPLDNAPAITGIVGTLPLPGVAQDITVDGARAIVALGAAGVAVVDASRVDGPKIAALVDTPGNARRVASSGNFVAVADGPAGLAILDVTDPPGAFMSALVTTLPNAVAVAAADGLAYVGLSSGAIAVVHLASGTILSTIQISGGIHDLVFWRNYLLAQTGNRLHVIEVTAGELIPVSSQAVSLFAEGITEHRRVSVMGNHALVASYPGYSAVDLSTPAAPVLVGNAVEHGPNSFKQILPTGSGLGVAAVGINPRNDGTHDVWLYDVRDPNRRTNFIAQFTTPGTTRALALNRGMAYVADGENGFHALNFLAADTGSTPPGIELRATFPLDPAIAETGTFAALIAETSDDVLVREVEFYINGVRVAADGNYPFEHRFRIPPRVDDASAFSIRARAIDTGGNETWTPEIRVAISPDLTPPRARPMAPSARGYDVSPESIGVYFNEEMDPSSITLDRLTLTYLGPDRQAGADDDRIVTGAIEYLPESRIARLRFERIEVAGRYEATLAPGARDLAGNEIRDEIVWAFEVVTGTDTDGDGLADEFELAGGMNPLDPDENRNGIPDALEDFDNDGVTNGEEMLIGTHPRQARTFDNVLDRDRDRDGDMLPDLLELAHGTDPTAWDTDGDGWNDEIEVAAGSNPLRPNRFFQGGRVSANAAQVLRHDGVSFGSGKADVLRLGSGSVFQTTQSADVLRWGGPNEFGHSVLPAPTVRVAVEEPATSSTSAVAAPPTERVRQALAR